MVLDRRHRLTSSAGFSAATRRGRRAGSSTLVVHLDLDPGRAARRARVVDPDRVGEPVETHQAAVSTSSTSREARSNGPHVGLVVARSVGNAVTRNRVRRRLRHLARERLSWLPASAVLVVRALPPAAEATYVTLGRDLDSALRRALGAGARRVR